MLTVRSEGYMTGMTSMMGQYEAATEAALLPQARVPTLITWGEKDRGKSLEELAELQAGLPDSMVARVPAAGHYVQEEAPGEVAAAMIAAKDRWL